jgi:hypothetical protein
MICRVLLVWKVFLYGRLTLILETKNRIRHKASSSATYMDILYSRFGRLDVPRPLSLDPLRRRKTDYRCRIASLALLLSISALDEQVISCATTGMANRNGLPKLAPIPNREAGFRKSHGGRGVGAVVGAP